MAEKKKKSTKKQLDPENLNMGINEFGELTTNINLDDLNEFLNQNVADRKLQEKADKEQAVKASKSKK